MFCDKCGREVLMCNDATVVEAEAKGNPFVALGYRARHFLPVFENGVMVCEGSPSRAQYIEGQPRDTRGYPYDPRREAMWRKAWAKVQAGYGSQEAEPEGERILFAVRIVEK